MKGEIMKKLLMSMALVASLAALTACGNPDTGKDPGGNTDDPGGNETPVVTVFAPAAAVSAEKGMTVTLTNYLVSEDTGYSVSFWYTFEGYGEMGATGAQPLEITQKTDADNSFAVNACGEYTIYFVAEKDGKTISEENAAFKLNASDPTQPVLNVSDVALDVSSISAADFTEKYVSVADDYYKELSVRVLQGGENKDTLTFQEGENEVTVEAEDGFGNRVQETVTVTVRTAIVEDPSVLDTVGGIIHHDFDEYASFGEFESSALPESIVGTDNAIEGNSLSLTFEAGGTNVSFFKNDKLSLGAGTYRISFRYKLLTESAPTYFCVGFVGSTQNNRENWFSGRSDEVGQVYEFSNDYKLEADEYYIQLFNLNSCDAKIVIDDFAIENVTQIDVSEILSEAGGKAVHDFDRNTMFGTFESSAMPESVVGTDNAIEGNSLSLTFEAGGTNISFFKNEMLSLGAGTYRISFRYKLLTETKPDYFCVGFNGSAQKNRENWFADRTDQANEIYEFTYDYELAAGEYYIQLFNLNKCDAKIVIDDIKIERVA